MQGRRNTMEDVVCVAGDLTGRGDTDLVALFDGHGGADVAHQAADYVREYLAGHAPAPGASDAEVQGLIARAFEEANKLVPCTTLENIQGSTALVCLLTQHGEQRRLHVGNIGDSRAVLQRADGTVVRASFDHKPLEAREHQRVRSCGGYVTPEGRVQGLLSVARALGDKALAPFVSAEPFLASYDLEGSRFLVLACDGVWDVVTDAEACRIVGHALDTEPDAAGAAALLRDCAYLNGSGDNISVMVCDLTAQNIRAAVVAEAAAAAR